MVHRSGAREKTQERTLARISVVPVLLRGADKGFDASGLIGPSSSLRVSDPIDVRSLNKRTLVSTAGDVLLLDARHTRPSVVYRAIVRARNAGWDRGIVLLLEAADLPLVPVASSVGASDFVLSSADPDEVETRLRRASGRPETEASQADPDSSPIRLHWRTHQISFEGTSISLTLREMQLLSVLIERKGSIITAEDLSREAWGKGRNTGGALIAAYVCSLRKKLAWFGGRFGIQTVRAVGYRFLM